MTCRQALLSAILCIIPVLVWLIGQVRLASVDEVQSLVQIAAHSLFLLIALTCSLCIPLLHDRDLRRQGWLACLLLVITPAPLYVAAWQTGAVSLYTLLAALLLSLVFALILNALTAMLNRWRPVTTHLHTAAMVTLAGLSLITVLLNLNTWQSWLRI